MTKVKRILALLLVTVFFSTMLLGCGSSDKKENNDAGSATSNETDADKEDKKPSEPVKVTTFVAATEKDRFQSVIDEAKKEGILIEPNLVPGDGVEFQKKVEIMFASNDKTDLIAMSNPMAQYKYAKANWLLPLDDLIKEKNYDAEKMYGKYLRKYEDKTLMLPYHSGGWSVFYNKKIFDDAKVPYPSGKWTWSEYIETAKKLTNPSTGIYGSYMLDYDCYFFFEAIQRGALGYKPDGTSNYDDPAFANAMKFFVDLGNVHKIQPSWLQFKTKKLAWDGFMSGKYGMWFIGSWAVGLFADSENYPRDWEYGITQIPTPDDGSGENNFGVTSMYAINANSEHPKEAFDALRFICENTYRIHNILPARVDLTTEDYNSLLSSIAENSGNNVTVDELRKGMLDDGLGFVDEKLVGPAMAQYSDIILQEGETYAVGGQTLEEAVKNIKKRADEAIANEGKN